MCCWIQQILTIDDEFFSLQFYRNLHQAFFFFFTAENNAYCYRSGNAAFVHPPSFLPARPLCFVLLLSAQVTDDLISNTWSIRHNNLVFYI